MHQLYTQIRNKYLINNQSITITLRTSSSILQARGDDMLAKASLIPRPPTQLFVN